MKGALLVLSLVVVVTQALPVDPRRGPADLRLDKVAQVDDRMRRAPMPDTPGLDPDEYNRYWGEMARNNPGTPSSTLSVCVYVLYHTFPLYFATTSYDGSSEGSETRGAGQAPSKSE